ncbi:hypothetical protein [Fischerella sp. PCC 9605]|uniref:hypothetical protein n=1 Tax=Fischerella sp. PCC 9605 TaxID=1173024 RepID=UPI000478E03B|nr:hypothetical protein [Fischerella sp. PCC 9605]
MIVCGCVPQKSAECSDSHTTDSISLAGAAIPWRDRALLRTVVFLMQDMRSGTAPGAAIKGF